MDYTRENPPSPAASTGSLAWKVGMAAALLFPTLPNLVLFGVTGSAFWLGQWLTSVLLVGSVAVLVRRIGAILLLFLPFALGAPFVAGYAWATGYGPSILALQILREATAEELRNFLPQILGCAVLAAAAGGLYLLVWRGGRDRRLDFNWRIRTAVAGLFLVALGKDMRHGWASGSVVLASRLERMYPAAPLALAVRLSAKGGVIPDRRLILRRYAVREDPAFAGLETCVFVLGESARADAFGLYRPPLPTTPRLGRRRDLIVFHDAKSCGTATIQAVPVLLTGRFPDLGEFLPFSHLDLVEAFRLAGFHTEWVSTQPADGEIASFITAFSVNADTRLYLSGRLEGSPFGRLSEHDDGLLLGALKSALAAPYRRQFILLHMIGSHAPYTARFPPAFARWPVDGAAVKRALLAGPPYDLREQEALDHAYFNSVLYTDWLLDQVIDLVSRRPGRSAVVFISDHGDNPAGAPLMPAAHAVLTRAVTTVPLFLWLSPELRREAPGKEAALRRHSTDPVSAQDVFSTVCGLFNLRTAEARPTRDLSGPAYRPHPRRVELLDASIVPAP